MLLSVKLRYFFYLPHCTHPIFLSCLFQMCIPLFPFLLGVLWQVLFIALLCAQLLSHGQLLVTPWTVTCQALLSMEFSRKDHWSRLSFIAVVCTILVDIIVFLTFFFFFFFVKSLLRSLKFNLYLAKIWARDYFAIKLCSFLSISPLLCINFPNFSVLCQ